MKHFIDISNFELKKLDSIIQKAKQIKKNHKKFSKKWDSCNGRYTQ